MDNALARHSREDVFRFYSTCKLVKGGACSAIYDLERRRLYRFDTAYFSLFALAAGEGIAVSNFDEMDEGARARALAAIEFLKERELGRFMDRVSARYLMPLPGAWDRPEPIMNAVIDVDDMQPDWAAIVAELDALQCRTLQVRCFSSLMSRADVERVLERLQGSCISRVEFVVKWNPEWDPAVFPDLFECYRNLLSVRLHSAPRDEEFDGSFSPYLVGRRVRLQIAAIDGAHQCGSIREGSLNIPSAWLYSELKAHNGCLNRKVSIRADGEICNCPSMKTGFGKDLGRLRQVVASAEFQRAWHLKKDDMRVCRGCEFRYVCTDCRAYLERDHSLDKPARCNYDPATGKWGEQSPAAPVAYEMVDVSELESR